MTIEILMWKKTNIYYRLVPVLCGLYVSGCETTGEYAARLAALTPEDFSRPELTRNSNLDVVATAATGQIYNTNTGRISHVFSPNSFIRANVDKRTGSIDYDVITELTYTGEWRFYETANFLTVSGPEQVRLADMRRDFSCTSTCSYVEVVSFKIPHSLMRQLAGYHIQGVSGPWTYRINSSGGHQEIIGVQTAELVAAVQMAERLATAAGHPPSELLRLRTSQ